MSELFKLVEQSKLRATSIRERYQIALVCNSRSKTRIINNQQIEYSENNEFFSDQEFSEIFDGIQASEFYILPFFNELTFIVKTLEESYFKNNKLVYNLSRNGKHVGKKSLIPSFCDLLSIPYTGSNALITSYCRAKYMYTKYLQAHQINTPKTWVFIGNNSWLNNDKPVLGTSIVLKSMHESASIGLEKNSIFLFDLNCMSHLESLYSSQQSPILIQELISGYECEVPLFIGDKIYAMDPVGISIDGKRNINSEILTYERSYKDQYGFFSLADEFNSITINQIKSIAIQVARLVSLTNYGRIDFRVDTKGIPYVIDIATSPYTTKHSSFAYSFMNLGIAYEDIYATIINLACKDSEI